MSNPPYFKKIPPREKKSDNPNNSTYSTTIRPSSATRAAMYVRVHSPAATNQPHRQLGTDGPCTCQVLVQPEVLCLECVTVGNGSPLGCECEKQRQHQARHPNTVWDAAPSLSRKNAKAEAPSTRSRQDASDRRQEKTDSKSDPRVVSGPVET
jgi:hypothetical protein